METDTFYMTAQTLWPLVVAAIVWIITMRRSADTDEISTVVEALTRSDAGPHHNASRSVRSFATVRDSRPVKMTPAKVETGGRLRAQLRQRSRHQKRSHRAPARARARSASAAQVI